MLTVLFNSLIISVPFVLIVAWLLYARGTHDRPQMPQTNEVLRQQLMGIVCPTCGRPMWTR